MKYNTGKREQILDFLSKNEDRSFTLEEIVAAVTDGGKGKSTVYRIVAELTSAGCIKRLSDGATRHCTYQYVGSDECREHLHLMCRDCGKLIHLDEEISHELCDTLLARGFSVEEGSMLFGKCEKCKTKEK